MSPPIREILISSISLLAGLALGLIARFKNIPIPLLEEEEEEEEEEEDEDSDEDDGDSADNSEDHKMVLCVRTDLKMSKGKIAAQAGHATLGAFKLARRTQPTASRIWEVQAQPKIALQISSRSQLFALEHAAKALRLVTYVVVDAGRTQIAAGSVTVLAVGPGPASLINQVTGSLKLL